VAPATPWPKVGWSSHPILGKGWLEPPGFPSALLFFFFFLKKNIYFLKLKPFTPKLRRFGQNDVILGSLKTA
jgi:hypothetical protein